MFKKIKSYFKNLEFNIISINKKIDTIVEHNKILENKLQELEWANTFHDSIQGNRDLNDISLNPGRWAANYSLFYILVRILYNAKPSSILEFGLGETSKIISKYIEFNSHPVQYKIIEHDHSWADHFRSIFELSNKSSIDYFELETKNIYDNEVLCLKNINHFSYRDYTFYLIDGPYGSDHYSRFDIAEIMRHKKVSDEFIVLIDDYNRVGEQETVNYVLNLLNEKSLVYYTKIFLGNKSQFLIATSKFKFLISI